MKVNYKSKHYVAATVVIGIIIIILVWLSIENDNKNMSVIVVNKCDYAESEFWEVAYEGMLAAAEDYNVKLLYMSPEDEHQIDVQKQVILQAIDKKPDAIILAASDYEEITPYALKIAENDIKLIMMDSDVGVSYDYKYTFIGTNSKKAGEDLGRMAKENSVDDQQKAIIIAHVTGAQTSNDRVEGIINGYGEENILDIYYSQSNKRIAYDKTLEIAKVNVGVVDLFCTNENVTKGVLDAIEEKKLENKFNVYGFDGSKKVAKYLEKGLLISTIIQRPFQMGYLSVESTNEVLNGKKVPKVVETDHLLITKDNMYEVGYREILFPYTR